MPCKAVHRSHIMKMSYCCEILCVEKLVYVPTYTHERLNIINLFFTVQERILQRVMITTSNINEKIKQHNWNISKLFMPLSKRKSTQVQQNNKINTKWKQSVFIIMYFACMHKIIDCLFIKVIFHFVFSSSKILHYWLFQAPHHITQYLYLDWSWFIFSHLDSGVSRNKLRGAY